MLSDAYLAHLRDIRMSEIDRIAAHLPRGVRILEIGGGTGEQAAELRRRGFDVVAIEIPDSSYAARRVIDLIDYDGRNIPLPDASVGAVFSSNVLEHVPDLEQMHSEIRRVLAPGGYGIHAMPTHVWRLWTLLTALPEGLVHLVRALPQLAPRGVSSAEVRRLGAAWYASLRHVAARIVQRRHGERGNTLSELWLFHPSWWRRNFADNGFEVASDEPMGLFYTGNVLFGRGLDIGQRARLARLLGSSCHLYRTRPRAAAQGAVPPQPGRR